MILLLKFFPSSAGTLASESTGVSNFGKSAAIQDVADLLKFAKEVRFVVEGNPNLQRNPQDNFGLAKIFKKYESLRTLTDLINNCIRLEYNPSGKKFISNKQLDKALYKLLH